MKYYYLWNHIRRISCQICGLSSPRENKLASLQRDVSCQLRPPSLVNSDFLFRIFSSSASSHANSSSGARITPIPVPVERVALVASLVVEGD
jgi:hypothetical protein